MTASRLPRFEAPRRTSRRRDERGQAALLAVVGLLVLAVGMYTTYNLSRAVYEKVQLQNATDATAYSLATLEARTFNFIAFANRAQIANYVHMMEAQGLLSNMTYSIGMLGWGGDVAQTSGRLLASWGISSGATLLSAGIELEHQHRLAREALFPAVAQTRAFMQRATRNNQAFFYLAAALALSTAGRLVEGAPDIVEANDDGAEMNLGTYALGAYNAATYFNTFDRSTWGLSAEMSDEARRILTELANATRYGSVAAGNVVARSPVSGLMQQFTSITERLGEVEANTSLGSGSKLTTRRQLTDLLRGFEQMFDGHFVGTTKLTGARETAMPERLAQTGRSEPDDSYLNTGNEMLSKDMARPGTPIFSQLARTGFASVASSPDESVYCFYDIEKVGNSYGGKTAAGLPLVNAALLALRLGRLLAAPGGDEGFTCARDTDTGLPFDPDLKWAGLAGYIGFSPGHNAWGVDQKNFNQPDVFVWLSKSPDDMALPSIGDLRFELRRGGAVASLDARIAQQGLFGSEMLRGFHALSRAQVYYHRPGAWQEPPNFMNPFWGARLAPKNAAIERALEEAGLGGFLSQLVADNVMMW